MNVTVIIIGNKDSLVYNGAEQKVEGYEVSISDELYTEDDFTFSGEAVAKGTKVGTYAMGLAEDQFANDNDNFEVTFQVTDGELEIVPKDITITADSGEKEYDGTPLTVGTYTSEGLAEGDGITSLTVTGSQTEVGESANVPSDAVITNAAGEDVTDCYRITYVNGTLKVTEAPPAAEYVLTINYVYEDGTTAAETYQATLAYGTSYSVKSPVIEGYTASIEVVEGEMPEHDVTYTVVYKKKPDEPEKPKMPKVSMSTGDIYE